MRLILLLPLFVSISVTYAEEDLGNAWGKAQGQFHGPSAILLPAPFPVPVNPDIDFSKLAKDLESEDSSVRLKTVQELKKLSKEHPAQTIPLLIKILPDEDWDIHDEVLAAFKETGVKSVNTLLDTVKKKDHPARESALEVLVSIGGDAIAGGIPLFIDILKSDENYWMRARAAQALGTIPGASQAVLPLARASALDEEEAVRTDARNSLAKLEEREKAFPELLKLALEKDDASAYRAIHTLDALGANSSATLLKVLKEGLPGSSSQAANCLGMRGAGEESNLDPILEILNKIPKSLAGYMEGLKVYKDWLDKNPPSEEEAKFIRSFTQKLSAKTTSANLRQLADSFLLKK